MKTDVNVPLKNIGILSSTDEKSEIRIISHTQVSTDPRIRIRNKISPIHNTGNKKRYLEKDPDPDSTHLGDE